MQATMNRNMTAVIHRHHLRQMWAWIIGTVLVSVLFTGWIMRISYVQRHETPMPSTIDLSARTGTPKGESQGPVKAVNGAGIVTYGEPDSAAEGK